MYVSVRRETCPWPYSGLSPPHDLRTRVETVPATNATTPAGPVFFYILAARLLPLLLRLTRTRCTSSRIVRVCTKKCPIKKAPGTKNHGFRGARGQGAFSPDWRWRSLRPRCLFFVHHKEEQLLSPPCGFLVFRAL